MTQSRTQPRTQPRTQKSQGMFWLASYPKSGNTWVRSFINAALTYTAKQQLKSVHEQHGGGGTSVTSEGLLDINHMLTITTAVERNWLEQILGFGLSDFTPDEIDHFRPEAYRWLDNQHSEVSYKKIHDAYTFLDDGSALIPADAMLGALYIIRNPLDIVISYANAKSAPIDEIIKNLANSDFQIASRRLLLDHQIRQRILSWSDHVLSWTRARDINRLVVRYEDMKQKPLATFSSIAKFLQLPHEQKTITTVLEAITIERLQAQEKENGFGEKPPKANSFFRKGIVGDWKDTLTPAQISRIIDDHHDVMQQFGYLDEQSNPTQLIMPE